MKFFFWNILRILLLAVIFSLQVRAEERTLPSVERFLVVAGEGFFPVALRLQDGRIAVVLRGSRGHLGLNGSLHMVFSEDEGKTWSKPVVVVDSPVDDRNPALGQAKDGTIVVGFYRTAQYTDDGKYDPKLDKPINTWATRSHDGGKSWDEPIEIDVSDISWGSPYGKILNLADGSMLMAVYGGPIRKPGEERKLNGRNLSYVYQSLDNGKTWRRFSGPIGDPKHQYSETSLLQLPSGKILAAVRDRSTELWTAESADGGKTWGDAKNLAPIGVCPADLLLLPDGRVLLVTGYRNSPFGVRGLLGDSSGKFDWEKRFVLVDDAISADCGYPSSVLLKDGRVLTVYYATTCKTHPEWKDHCGAVIYRPDAP